MTASFLDSEMQQAPVVILGAGIGGLTLARCLRQRGIHSVIYEKATSAPRHTYGITLESWSYRPILGALELEEDELRRRIAVDRFYRDGTGRVSPSGHSILDTATSFRASRHDLESLLRVGQIVNFEYSLSSAAMSTGKTELIFHNGLTISPDLVVDTMGVHSQLRKSLLPDIMPQVLPYAVFSGKRYLKHSLFQDKYASHFQDGNILTLAPRRAHEPRLEISVNDHQPDGNVSISYIYSRAAKFDHASDPLHNPDRPNAGASQIPEELYDELAAFLKRRKLQEPWLDAFDCEKLRKDRLLHWLMRTTSLPGEVHTRFLEAGTVILGDSAHATPILGGHGANYAIRDAIVLADVIATSGTDKAALATSYRTLSEKWRAELEDSKKEIASMHRL